MACNRRNMNSTLDMFTQSFTDAEYIGVYLVSDILSIIFTIVCFIFKGLAIRYMAKQKGFKKLWMAFVPFLNYYLLGKVLGKAIIWGQPIKNVGLWVAILSAVQFVLSTLLTIGNISVYLEYLGYTVEYTSKFVERWVMGQGLLYAITYYVSLIVDLAYIVLHVSLVFLAFRKYNPQRAFLFSILSVFFSDLFGIFLFVSRKNKPFNYEDYVRAQRSYYGSYYGGGYRPNGEQNAPNGEEKPKVEDPFPEFESDNKNDSDNFFN